MAQLDVGFDEIISYLEPVQLRYEVRLRQFDKVREAAVDSKITAHLLEKVGRHCFTDARQALYLFGNFRI